MVIRAAGTANDQGIRRMMLSELKREVENLEERLAKVRDYL
jgi:hypothetical protein